MSHLKTGSLETTLDIESLVMFGAIEDGLGRTELALTSLSGEWMRFK